MMKPRKRNREWMHHPAAEEAEWNQVTGFLSTGNAAMWASLDGGGVSNQFCVHEGTSNKTCLADDLVMQTYRTDESLCTSPWSSCQIFPFRLFLLFLLSHQQSCHKGDYLLKKLWIIQEAPMVMVIALSYCFPDTLVSVCPEWFSHDC